MVCISSSFANHRLPFVVTLLIALPWLNPFAPGPTPSTLPLLFSWACAAVLLVLLGLPTALAHRERYTDSVAHAWLVAALLSSAMALLQYFGQASSWVPWVNAGTTGEAFANLRQRNQFATLTSIGLVALLWQVAQVSAREPLGPRAPRWLMCGVAALLLATGNAASGSRTGLFQWCLVAGLALLWWRVVPARRQVAKPILVLGLGALGLYCLSVLVLPLLLEWATGFQSAGLLGRFKDEVGCHSRRVLWSNVLHLVAQKPWLGWGWGELGYAHFVTLYPGERFCDILDNAHNLPLHLAVELGVPLALTVCGTLVWLVLRAKPWREPETARQLAWGVLCVVGLHSLLEYPLWYGPFQMAVGLSVWLLRSPKCQWQFAAPARIKVNLIASILIAFLGYAGWDYWRVSQLYMADADRAVAYRYGTLDKVRNSRLFQNQVQFAELTTTPVTPENALQIRALAQELLHFSPEPRVVEKRVESAVLLGLDGEAIPLIERYKAAFPREHARWAESFIHEGGL